MSASLRRVVEDIQSFIRAANRLDAQIGRVGYSCPVARSTGGPPMGVEPRDIIKECERRGITEDEWCKQELRSDIATMRRRVQLYRNWDEYAAQTPGGDQHRAMGVAVRVVLNPGQPQIYNELAAYARPFRKRWHPDRGETGSVAVQFPHRRRIGNAEIDPNRQHPVHHHIAAVLAPPPDIRRHGHRLRENPREIHREFVGGVPRVQAGAAQRWRALAPSGDSHSHGGGQWRPDSYIAWRPTQQKQVMQDGMRLPSTTSIRPPKSLLMIPALVVLAMQDEGWLLRSKIIWDKGFARPDSAKDRPTVTHGELFVFSKSARYTYDPDPIRVPYVGPPGRKLGSLPGSNKPGLSAAMSLGTCASMQTPSAATQALYGDAMSQTTMALTQRPSLQSRTADDPRFVHQSG